MFYPRSGTASAHASFEFVMIISRDSCSQLIWSEFNARYMNEPEVTDSTYVGPWIADAIRQCDGPVDMMSYSRSQMCSKNREWSRPHSMGALV